MTPRFLSYPVERLLLFQKVIRSALCAYQGGYPTSHMRLYPLLSATFVPSYRVRLDVFSSRTSFCNQHFLPAYLTLLNPVLRRASTFLKWIVAPSLTDGQHSSLILYLSTDSLISNTDTRVDSQPAVDFYPFISICTCWRSNFLLSTFKKRVAVSILTKENHLGSSTPQLRYPWSQHQRYFKFSCFNVSSFGSEINLFIHIFIQSTKIPRESAHTIADNDNRTVSDAASSGCL